MNALTTQEGGAISFAEIERMAPVVGFEELYSASDRGRIWAFPKKSRLMGRWLKEQPDRSGYRYVCLFKDGVRTYPKVHRLVLMAFYGGDWFPLQANHINGLKADNRLCNLEWLSASANRRHAWATGLQTASPANRRASRENIIAWNTRTR